MRLFDNVLFFIFYCVLRSRRALRGFFFGDFFGVLFLLKNSRGTFFGIFSGRGAFVLDFSKHAKKISGALFPVSVK